MGWWLGIVLVFVAGFFVKQAVPKREEKSGVG